MAGWGSIYKPHRESSRWGRNLAFCYGPDAAVVLTGYVQSSRPLERALIGLWAESGLTRSDATGRTGAALEPL